MTTAAALDRSKSTHRKCGRTIGKDELNLADWRISLPQHQQPRKTDGGKLDYIHYEINRSGQPAQAVTVMAPSRLGLPTPTDEDVLIALLYLAKRAQFRSDKLHFTPRQLLLTLRWGDRQSDYARLEESLLRLKAVTIKYELAWYVRAKADVEPVLMTGILAEAKLVKRRERLASTSIPDSYVQWTDTFYQSLQSGNLTDLDLDLYFGLRRPGSRQLYRHLNKRFRGKHKGSPYERDLRNLACGHLGMKDCKDLKRNFHRLVKELEDAGYLAPMLPSARYRKVRPGIWRVRFELARLKLTGQRRGPTKLSKSDSPARQLVKRYHHERFGVSDYQPLDSEIAYARELIAAHGEQLFDRLLSKIVARMKASYVDGKLLTGAKPYVTEIIAGHCKQEASREKLREAETEATRADRRFAEQRQGRSQRHDQLRQQIAKFNESERATFWQFAMDTARSDFDRQVLGKARSRCELPLQAVWALERWLEQRG